MKIAIGIVIAAAVFFALVFAIKSFSPEQNGVASLNIAEE